MTKNIVVTPTDAKMPQGRGLSQIMFVVIGLGIITGGLWTLYMADAPYHPEVDIQLAAD